MRHRNFTIDEATELNRLVTELLPKIQAMPFGKRIKDMTCQVDDDADPNTGFPEIRVKVDGKLSDSHLKVLCGLAGQFPQEDVPGSTCKERLGVCTMDSHKVTSSMVTFKWCGLRKIDSINLLDYFYADGTFSPTFLATKKVEGIVYFVDAERVRIMSVNNGTKLPWCTADAVRVGESLPVINPFGIFEADQPLEDLKQATKKVEGIVYFVDAERVRIMSVNNGTKLPWCTADAVRVGESLPVINPFGIFEADQPLEDLKQATNRLLKGIENTKLKKKDFPALAYVLSYETERIKKGNWHMVLPGDAVHLYSRKQRGELSRNVKRCGGKGLCKNAWLGKEFDDDLAYMVQVTSVNSMIKPESKKTSQMVIPVAELDWETIENF